MQSESSNQQGFVIDQSNLPVKQFNQVGGQNMHPRRLIELQPEAVLNEPAVNGKRTFR